MMSTPRNPKIFLMLSGLMLLGGAAASYQQYGSLTRQDKSVQELRAVVQDESEVKAKLDKSREQLEQSADRLGHLEKGIPQFAYIPTMLFELDRMGKSVGIEVLGVRPMPKQQAPMTASKEGEESTRSKKPYEELNIEVKGRGSYRSVMNFMKALQKFPKIVAARTISLTPKPGSSEDEANRLEVQIELRAYLFPQSQPQTKLSAMNWTSGEVTR